MGIGGGEEEDDEDDEGAALKEAESDDFVGKDLLFVRVAAAGSCSG